jgi:hypothetical protein
MCQQILIFKLELEPNIKKIFESVANLEAGIPRELPVTVWNAGPVPVPIPAAVPVPVLEQAPRPHRREYGMLENNGETNKVEAFADDTSPIGRLD